MDLNRAETNCTCRSNPPEHPRAVGLTDARSPGRETIFLYLSLLLTVAFFLLPSPGFSQVKEPRDLQRAAAPQANEGPSKKAEGQVDKSGKDQLKQETASDDSKRDDSKTLPALHPERVKYAFYSLYFTVIPVSALVFFLILLLHFGRPDSKANFESFFGGGQTTQLVVILVIAGNVCSLAFAGIIGGSEVAAEQYCVSLAQRMTRSETLRVLDLGCGPAREVYDLCQTQESHQVLFDCVDQDLRAIEYARELNRNFSQHARFTCRNVRRSRISESYDLIWGAGIFDYFNDRAFSKTLIRMLPLLRPDGRFVVVNFSPHNPTRDYMECGQWFVWHRTEDHLRQLAADAGVSSDRITMEEDIARVVNYMHISQH